MVFGMQCIIELAW